jgi:hypothetical protein
MEEIASKYKGQPLWIYDKILVYKVGGGQWH